jgi:hypothetical protein
MGNSSRFGRNSSTGNVLADECGGGICSEEKRFLVTIDSVMGDEALGACPSGFHFASLWEIMDYSNLAYDTVLGRVNDDSGSGPAANQFGWVRSGIEDSSDYNCGTWSGTGDGLEAYLVRPENLDDAGTKVPFWRFETSACTLVSRPVWCVED